MLKVTYQNFIAEIGGGGIELKVISTKRNSGAPGTPINIGIGLARGRYVQIVDSDDLIKKTALEELFNLAEKFQADVVHCEKFFQVPEDWKFGDKRELFINGLPRVNFVTEPTFATENFTERAVDLSNYRYTWNPWVKMIRREFIVKNNLKILDVAGQDMLFTCCLVCSAKKYLRVPNIVNFYRIRSDSLSHESETQAEKLISQWVKAIVVGFNYVNNFLNEQEYFQKNLDAKYFVFEIIVKDFSHYLFGLYTQFPASQLDALIQQEFEKCRDLTALTTFIFSRMNIFNINLIQQQNLIQRQQELINKFQKLEK